MNDCEICRNHELCRLENKDKIKNCFYVYPTKEYLASKTEEYKLGYNKALDDFANGIKEILEDNAIYNMDCIYTLAEQLKVGGEND